MTILDKLTMIKNWMIAGCLLVGGLFAAVLFGKHKQEKKDGADVDRSVQESLDRIAKVSKEENTKASDAGSTGPDANGNFLREHWSED